MLILGGSVSQLPAIRHARASGLRVVVADGDGSALGFDDADAAEAIDFSDADALVDVASVTASTASPPFAATALSSRRQLPRSDSGFPASAPRWRLG